MENDNSPYEKTSIRIKRTHLFGSARQTQDAFQGTLWQQGVQVCIGGDKIPNVDYQYKPTPRIHPLKCEVCHGLPLGSRRQPNVASAGDTETRGKGCQRSDSGITNRVSEVQSSG